MVATRSAKKARSAMETGIAHLPVEAHYDAGVLTLRVPVAEQAKPRKIEISTGGEAKQIAA